MRPYFLYSAILVVFAIAFQGGCTRMDYQDGVYTNLALASELTSKSPEYVARQGFNLVISADLWIDRMPKVGAKSDAIHGVVTIEDRGGQKLPDDLTIDKVMVVNGEKVWVLSPEKSERETPLTRSVHFSGDPDWKDPALVQVVAAFSISGKTYMVRKSAVEISTVH